MSMKSEFRWCFRFLLLIACLATFSTASQAQQGVFEDLAHCQISVIYWAGDPVWPGATSCGDGQGTFTFTCYYRDGKCPPVGAGDETGLGCCKSKAGQPINLTNGNTYI